MTEFTFFLRELSWCLGYVLKFIPKGNSLDLGSIAGKIRLWPWGKLYVIRFLTDYIKNMIYRKLGKWIGLVGTLQYWALRPYLQNKLKELGQLFLF